MMRRFVPTITIVIAMCLLAAGIGAEDQPKRVMNFIAVMDLRCGSGIDKETGVALTEVLINEMVKMKKYTVIDRANRDKILSEAGFQQTACVDESCTIEMGRQLGVGKIIVGSITKVGKTYVVNLQLINVETAAIETSASETCEGCEIDKLIGAIATAARKLMGEEAPQPAVLRQPAPPAAIIPQSVETKQIANSGLFTSYQEGKAMVIFFAIPFPSHGIGVGICDGQNTIGYVWNLTYFYYETNPGVHNFTMACQYSDIPKYKNLMRSTGDLELSAGKTVFMKIVPTLGPGYGISITEPSIGLTEAQKCKYKPRQINFR